MKYTAFCGTNNADLAAYLKSAVITLIAGIYEIYFWSAAARTSRSPPIGTEWQPP
jgi:hypothetical protein